MIEVVLGVVVLGGFAAIRGVFKNKELKEKQAAEQENRKRLVDNQATLHEFLKDFHESGIIRSKEVNHFKTKYRDFYETIYKPVVINIFNDIEDEDFNLMRTLFLSEDSFEALEQSPKNSDDILDEFDINNLQSLINKHNNEAFQKYFDQEKNKQQFKKFISQTYEKETFLTKDELECIQNRFDQLYKYASWLGEEACCNNSQLCVSAGRSDIQRFFDFYKNKGQFFKQHNLSIAEKSADVSAIKINNFNKALSEKKFIRTADSNKLIKEYQDTYKEILPLKENKKLEILSKHSCAKDVFTRFINFFEDTEEIVRNHNKQYILKRLNEFKEKFIHCTEYIDKTKADHFKEKFESDRQDILDGKKLCPPEHRKLYDQFEEFFKDNPSAVKIHNDDFIKQSMKEHQSFFQNIDGKKLDEDQQRAIIIDELSNLTVAGAGCGKTLTIVGKVKYLCEICNVRPEQIAVFSFSKKAVQEMQERLKNAGIAIDEKEKIDNNTTIKKSGVTVRTFHSYARSSVHNSKQLNTDILDECIKRWTAKELASDEARVEDLYKYFAFHLNPAETREDLEDVTCLGDYYQKQRRKNLKPLKAFAEHDDQKQRPRNQFELEISNYLYSRSINYKFEPKKGLFTLECIDTQTKQHKTIQLRTLSLPFKNDYARLLSPAEKRKEKHKNEKSIQCYQQNTKIIDLEPVDENGNKFERRLGEALANYQLVPKDHTEIVQNILSPKDVDKKSNSAKKKNNSDAENFQKLIKTCIDRFRCQRRGIEDVEKIISDAQKEGDKRKEYFYKIVKDVYQYFLKHQVEKNEIDFTDIIADFIDAAKENKLKNIPFKYIIVDEFQDIDSMQYEMINEMRRLTGAKLMCVGDDWQSIYRFRGSNLSYFNNFQKFFGTHVRQDIKTTYRNSQQLLDVAGTFIQQNKFQLTKELKSKSEDRDTPIVLIKYMSDKNRNEQQNTSNNPPGNELNAVLTALRELPSDSKACLVLGRYNWCINIFKNNGELFEEKENKEKTNDGQKNEIWIGSWRERPDLEITCMSVHKSKGLQFENVIIVELKNAYKGFPSQMEDDPVLKPSEDPEIRNNDNYPFSEERRLFYVAMTRTKNRVYLIGPANIPSIFMQEIEEIAKKQEKINPRQKLIRIETIGVDDGKPAPQCPKCKTGLLIEKKNNKNNNLFVGCSNHPSCDYKNNSLDILKNPKICPKCGDYLVRKNGPHGEFWGCSNYKDIDCRHTEKIK